MLSFLFVKWSHKPSHTVQRKGKAAVFLISNDDLFGLNDSKLGEQNDPLLDKSETITATKKQERGHSPLG